MRGERQNILYCKKMVQYCEEIVQILEKHHFDREEFEDNMEFQFACGMCIIQIGELVARLDEDFITGHTDIPWRQIKGMRNVYAHDYDIVDNDMVWLTITEELPELKKKLQDIAKMADS